MVFRKIILMSALSTFLAACTDGGTASRGTLPTDTVDPTGSDGESINIADLGADDGADAGADDGTGTGTDAEGTDAEGTDAEGTDADGTGTGTAGEITVGSGGGDRVNLLGLLKIEPNISEADFARALFGRLPDGLTGDEIQNFYAPTSDTCQVTSGITNELDTTQFNGFEQQIALISSGETLVISSDAGTFATLNSVQGPSGPVYQTNVALNVDLPGGLTADVVGDEFPAFSGAPIADVPALQVFNPPAGQDLTAFDVFNWNTNEDSLSVVEFYTGGIGANGEPIVIGCTAVDDGSFAFPDSVRAEMGDSYEEVWSVSLRVVYNISRNGDALLVTANSVFGARQ